MRWLCHVVIAVQEDMTYEQAIALADTETKHIKVLADADQADNELEFKRRKGDNIVYGQTIQLLHVNSGRYLRSSSSITSRLENR
jgi:hypothetical protein